MRSLIYVAMGFLCLGISGHASAAKTAQEIQAAYHADLQPHEVQMIEATNRERAARGLRPLVADPRLQAEARAHTDAMCRAGSMYHSSGARENVAWGQRGVAEVIRTWINSSGHYANMMSGCTRCGMAGYRDRWGTYRWCQRFR